MSILVCEGADGTGKTSLARELEQRGFRYVHNGTPPAGVSLYQHYTDQILACQPGENVVFDRLHVGELVYGPVMRGESLITVEEMRILNRLIFAKGGKVIFCDTDDEVIEKNWSSRDGQEYVDDEGKLYEVIFRYRQLMAEELHPSVRETHDYLRHNLIPQLEKLFTLPSCPEGMWGSPQSSFLIVGERSAASDWDRAFCSMAGSSGFLNRCLWEAGYPEHELAFTNSRKLDGTCRDLRKLYRDRSSVVITCGAVADADCSLQGVPHLTAEHPQFIKRFRSKQRGRYVEKLRGFSEGLDAKHPS